MKNITLIESGEYTECKMIGTILNVPNTPEGLQDFKERVDRALSQHFDCDPGLFKIHGINDAFNVIMGGGAESDFHLSFEDENVSFNGEITLMETWIY